jgi:hypothetical protein
VLKQVKNVYKIPFNKMELDSIRETIQFNCVQSMNILIKALVDYEIAVDSRTAKLVTQYTQCNTELTLPTAILIAKLWPRKPIQEAWAKRDEFWYLDAASYYFEHVERIGDPDFEPTEEDIVMARVRTTGISVTEFTQNGIDYSIVDVGGQRNERKKWIHCFPERDSQLLTSRGFLFLATCSRSSPGTVAPHDGAIVVTDWRGLTVATYCERTTRLVYRTPNALVVNDAGAQALAEFSSSTQASSSARRRSLAPRATTLACRSSPPASTSCTRAPRWTTDYRKRRASWRATMCCAARRSPRRRRRSTTPTPRRARRHRRRLVRDGGGGGVAMPSVGADGALACGRVWHRARRRADGVSRGVRSLAGDRGGRAHR